MRAFAVAAALVALGGTARADAPEGVMARIGDGAPVYFAARPVALIGALQRVGFDQLQPVQRLRRQLGGIDPFNPAILAAPGIDVAAPMVLSLFEPAGPSQLHSRLAATLRDPATFATFVDAVAASGQVKLQHVDAASPLGKQGVVATGSLSSDVAIIVRVRESEAILDMVSTTDGKKAPAPAELPRRFPLTPARPFTVAHGARRLFAPEAAAVAYVDGRRMQPLLQSIAADDRRRALRWAAPADKAKLEATQKARDKRCAVWSRAPSTFDDVGLALTAAPEGLSLTWAWGTQSGAPLGGLKMHPVDDAGLDAEMIGRDATAVIALYAASLSPFAALKRSAPFTSSETLGAAIDGCDTLAGATLLVRSWPLAIGAVTAPKPGDTTPLATMQQSFAALRTVVFALRDVTQSGPRGVISATFDSAARSMLELLLSTSAQPGAVTTIGKRSPTVYAVNVPGFPRQLAAALESLTGGKVGFTLGDSDEALTWAYRAAELPQSAPEGGKTKPPLGRVAADLTSLAKLGPLLSAGRDEQQLLELLSRLRRVDGELVADGDLFRLTLRSPLKQ
ncbi:MAG: hypothetical protein JWM53_4074 [bacterium]|nr:hypothetical protein [bacterium]